MRSNHDVTAAQRDTQQRVWSMENEQSKARWLKVIEQSWLRLAKELREATEDGAAASSRVESASECGRSIRMRFRSAAAIDRSIDTALPAHSNRRRYAAPFLVVASLTRSQTDPLSIALPSTYLLRYQTPPLPPSPYRYWFSLGWLSARLRSSKSADDVHSHTPTPPGSVPPAPYLRRAVFRLPCVQMPRASGYSWGKARQIAADALPHTHSPQRHSSQALNPCPALRTVCAIPSLHSVYLQYELYTTTYMLQWWEKCIFSQPHTPAAPPQHSVRPVAHLVARSYSDRHADSPCARLCWSPADALMCMVILGSNYVVYRFLFKGWKHDSLSNIAG